MDRISYVVRNMQKAGTIAASLMLLATLRHANAYEVRTHQRLTLAAVEASILADATRGPLNALDIADSRELRFQSIIPAGPVIPFVDETFHSLRTSAVGLVGLGAIYEDHPHHDPRFVRHFFDPQQNGRGLLGDARPSPEWILEPAGSGSIEEQEFSLADAREFYRQALSLSNRQARERPTILLMQTLGHVVHHLQDMAQPAHVRDDIHPPWEGDDFERYTEVQFADLPTPLPAGGTCGEGPVDLRVFDQAVKFWANGGVGIAEFTSTNFLSRDTVFQFVPNGPVNWITDDNHPLPAYPSNPVFDRPTMAELGVAGSAPNTRLSFLGLPIIDMLTGEGCFNSRAAMLTYSSRWSSSANMPMLMPALALNRHTYEGNYRILLPRAIAYSTGMLNYFFRGRMELVSYEVAGGQVHIVIRNASAAAFPLAQSAGSGIEEFSLYYDARDGQRREFPLQNADLGASVIAHGETYSLSFPLPADVDPLLEKAFTLVFDGTIGLEPGIAALKIGATPDTFLITPNYVPVDGIAGSRLITRVAGGWQVNATANSRAGNVVWRGHAVDDVLSWDGPQGRYFGTSVNSSNIYRGGAVLAVAPGTVIGTAINTQGGQRHLIAAVNANGTVRIYRRPFQLSYQRHGLYDALNNPLGWQLIHSQFIAPSTPMFFNASGNEGQLFGGPAVRYRMRITGTAVSAIQFSNVGNISTTRVVTTDRNGSADVNPGPPLSCKAAGSTCVSERGTCTTPQGQFITNVCPVSEAREAVSNGLVTNWSTTRDNIASSVVCADYRGDIEVLCLVEADETGGLATEDNTARWDSTLRWMTDQSCRITSSGPAQYRHAYNLVETLSSTMQFKLGSLTIPLSGTNNRLEKHYNSIASWTYGNPPAEPTVSYSLLSETTVFDTKLLYVDARNGIVAHEDHQRHNTETASGSAPAYSLESPNSQYVFLAQGGRASSSTSRVVVQSDREYLVSSRTTPGESSAIAYQENTGFSGTSIATCIDNAPNTSTDVVTSDWNPDNFFGGSVHQNVYGPVSQSFSAISNDRFVASLPIWVRQPSGSYVREGTWNFLSDGTLGSLLPTAPASATYVQTGVVR